MSALLLFAAVFVAAFNLRSGISSLGAVLADALAAFGVGGSLAGVITAIPGLFFSVLGLLAVPLATRMGLSRTLFIGMALSLLGLAARPWVGDIWAFIVLTVFVTVGIALANVLLPAWIKNHGGRHIVALMTVYGSVLGISGAAGPLTALLSDDFRWALFLWAVPAALQVVVWFVVVLRVGRDVPTSTSPRAEQAGVEKQVSLWRSPTAVFLMMFFGLQSMHAYIQMGWLPKILVDHGVSASTASLALAWVGSFNIVGGLIMPVIIDRLRSIVWLPVLFSALMAAGYLGLWLAPSASPLLWASLLGIGGFCFPTAIALIPARSRVPLVTARLSGFVQPVGYVIAAVGPLVVGVVRESTGDWSLILPVLAAICVLMGAVGFRAARASFVDDELAGQR
ncbi:MFS transporter, CP family, cyanate transporter [Corynebacterium pollutisoli]|uniref:MFS transporter, CP family, cyanate transporter n=2 Tax=Corynebacterium pollutisoli TaxID=1610489 RepID=A0A1X7JVN6_9CORY|nr:MFS transporter [Corynebacterium pollutisoli]SMG32418.1 MFS transporter, CP family, cyanate transporter [Corynebacterium pollutisoli]